MSIHKAQGQTLTQCGVLLPEPVFTHGQLYVCASRSSSAAGLRFWLGEPIDGHGYDEKAVPHTHNIIFPAVLSMLNTQDAQEKCPDPLIPGALPAEVSLQGARDPEYVELSEMEQRSLHETLYKSYAAAPAEIGLNGDALDADDLRGRAALVGISGSVWAERSQRPVEAIEVFLQAFARQNDPGASSSAG